MSAAELRQAAALMRERAEAARGERPDWFTEANNFGEAEVWAQRDELDYAPTLVISTHDLRKTPGAFEHFAPLTPAVALAVADWLDGVALYVEAKDGEEYFDLDGDPIAPEDTHAIGSALKVARAYLGSAS